MMSIYQNGNKVMTTSEREIWDAINTITRKLLVLEEKKDFVPELMKTPICTKCNGKGRTWK